MSENLKTPTDQAVLQKYRAYIDAADALIGEEFNEDAGMDLFFMGGEVACELPACEDTYELEELVQEVNIRLLKWYTWEVYETEIDDVGQYSWIHLISAAIANVAKSLAIKAIAKKINVDEGELGEFFDDGTEIRTEKMVWLDEDGVWHDMSPYGADQNE